MTLQKDKENVVICGVCSGLAEHFDCDPIIPRFLFVIATLLGAGLPILIYIVLACLMPSGKEE